MSDGQLTISLVPPEEIEDYQETLNLVSSGKVEMCRSLSYDWRDRGFAFDIFTFVPFGMNEFERVVWLQNFDGQQLWDDLYQDLNVKPFLCGSVGPQAFGWFADSITSVEQFKGLRYRTTGINAVIMEKLGAIPQEIGLADIDPAFRAGQLDAFELVGPAVDMEYGLDKFLPVYIYPSFHQTTGSIELVINLQEWQKLPNNLKQIVKVAAQAEHEANLADVYASNARALKILKQDRQIRIETLNNQVLTAIGNVTGEVLQGIHDRSSQKHRRIFDSFLAARQSLKPWIGSRDIYCYQPEQIKRVRILRRADGYYVQFSIKLDPRDTVKPISPSQKAVGIDVGLKYFYADSHGEVVSNPRFYRKSERQLNRANRQKSKKFHPGKAQSQNYRKARQRYALKHLKVSRQREEFAKRVALRLIQSNDLIVCEDLNVKGLVKNRRLSKSISDVAWSKFRQWLEYFGDKYGKLVVTVPPHYTSVNCSACGNKVTKTLSTRTHVCSCGYTADRDLNAAVNILQLGLSRVGRTLTNAWGDLSSSSVGEILLGYDESLNQESSSL